jgi:hypothetical protein
VPRWPSHRHCRLHQPPLCSEQAVWLVCTRGHGISAMKWKFIFCSCLVITFLICAYESSLFWTHSGTFALAEYAQTFTSWRKIRRESSFGNHVHYFVEKILRIQGKPLSFGITINARWQSSLPMHFHC